MESTKWLNVLRCYLRLSKTEEEVIRDIEQRKEYYDEVYDKFLVKAKDRNKIERREFHDIIHEIALQFPDVVHPYVITEIILWHGWFLCYEGDTSGDPLEFLDNPEGWFYNKKQEGEKWVVCS